MTASKPPIVRPTRALPFDQIPWDDFERLCLRLLPREGFQNPQHYGAAGGEQWRDIVAHRDGDLWYVQCKRVKRCGPKVLLDEIEKVQRLMEDDPDLRPAGMLFIVSCDVSATARDRTIKRCKEFGLVCEVWGRTDLDARVQPHPDIVRTFFGFERYARPIGVLFQAPPLPAHFVPRPEVSDAVRVHLLADVPAAPGVLVISAIHGLGGIGKSVLAAALAHEREVQARFPDGVLWVTLGREPDVLSLLAGWIQALGDYDFHPTTVEMASPHLRSLLHDKAALLVVDDVWDPAHALPFKTGGPRCQVLVTTRRADVADEVGAELYQLDVMTPEQSLGLLAAYLGHALEETERDKALRLAEALGYLPLALELAAARIARGVAWGALRQALEEEIARLEALEGPRRKTLPRLAASFNLSLDGLRAENEQAWSAFAWLGVLPEDVAVTAPMVATLWEMDRAQAAETLELLWNDALLLPGSPVRIGEGRWPSYRLHDLLHDTARRLLTAPPEPRRSGDLQGLGLTLPEAHACLLKCCRAQTRDGLWHTLPDNSYIHAHLTWHMERAGWSDELHDLLQEEATNGRNSWWEVRDRLGQMAGYLTDVARAWRLADAEAFSQQDVRMIGLGVRYALIISSLNSLAGNIGPTLLIDLVENEIWGPAKGLAYARQMPESRMRAEALVKLVPYLPGSLLEEALVSAWEIRDNWHRTRALVRLALHLSSPLREEVLQEALAVARQIDDASSRANVLADLALHLSSPLREEALQKALAVARQIDDASSRANVLADLASHLSEPLQSEIIRESFAAAIESEYESSKIGVLSRLAPHLPEPLLRDALTATREIEGAYQRFSGLSKLAPHLPKSLKEEALRKALAAVQELPEQAVFGKSKPVALAKLAPCLPESLLGEALLVAQEFRGIRERAKALTELIPYVPDSLFGEVLSAAEELPEGDRYHSPKARFLVELAPYLSEPMLQDAVVAARNIRNAWYRARALTELGFHLPTQPKSEVLREALAVTSEIKDSNHQTWALIGLVPYLPTSFKDEVLPKALAAARRLEYASSQVAALTSLAPHLPKSLKEGILQEALMASRRINSDYSRSEKLIELVPHLPETLIGEALVATCEIGNGGQQAKVLESLAPRLSHAQLGDALAAAQKIDAANDRAAVLIGLAPHLPESLLREALAAAREIKNAKRRTEALGWLAVHLADKGCSKEAVTALQESDWEKTSGLSLGLCDGLRGLPSRLAELGYSRDALAAARSIKGLLNRGRAFAKLIPHLPDSLKTEALRDALATRMKIGDTNFQVMALTNLALYLSEPFKIEALREAMALAGMIERNWTLTNTLEEICPLLPESLFREALAAAWEIDIALGRASALTSLAPHLPEPFQSEALQEAFRAIERAEDRDVATLTLCQVAHQLAELGPAEKALAVVERIKRKSPGDGVRTEKRVAIRLLQRGYVEDALAVARQKSSAHSQAEMTAELFPYLPEQYIEEALAVIREYAEASHGVKLLAQILPFLPDPLKIEILEDALAIAEKMKANEYRNGVLADLIPRLAELGHPEKALELVQQIRDSKHYAKTLARLALYLTDDLLRDALAMVWMITSETEQAKVLVEFASRFPVSLLKDTLEAIRRIENARQRAQLLMELALQLPEQQKREVLSEALTTAQLIGDKWSRATQLKDLAPYMPDEFLGEIIKAAQEIEDERRRGSLIADVTLHLPDSLREWALEEGLRIARRLPPEDHGYVMLGYPRGYPRADALTALATELASLPRDTLARIWLREHDGANLLHVLALDSRQYLLSDLRILAPVIAALGGEEVVTETFRAIQDVGRWWP